MTNEQYNIVKTLYAKYGQVYLDHPARLVNGVLVKSDDAKWEFPSENEVSVATKEIDEQETSVKTNIKAVVQAVADLSGVDKNEACRLLFNCDMPE